LENRREGPGPPEERGLPREFDDFLLFSIMSSRDMSRAVVVIFQLPFSLSLAECTRSRRQNCGNREREGLEEEREARVSSHHHYLILSSSLLYYIIKIIENNNKS